MIEHMIRTESLSYRYRKVQALDAVNFELRTGEIFALLGPNGAGKTTMIDLLMGLLRPNSGRAEVLGRDSRRLRPAELAQIGYVSDDQQWPKHMTLGRYIGQISPLYPTWDEQLCANLMHRFELRGETSLGSMSRGERMRARLLTAVAYRPRLLLLDEPFSGLDPMVRDDVVEGVLELASEQPWSILIATHELTMAERLADRVGFLSLGEIWLTEDLESLLARCRRVRIELDQPLERGFAPPPSWVDWQAEGTQLSFFDTNTPKDSQGHSEGNYANLPGVRSVSTHEPSLEQIFVALHRRSKGS